MLTIKEARSPAPAKTTLKGAPDFTFNATVLLSSRTLLKFKWMIVSSMSTLQPAWHVPQRASLWKKDICMTLNR